MKGTLCDGIIIPAVERFISSTEERNRKRNSMEEHKSVDEWARWGMNGYIRHERRYRAIHVLAEFSLLE